MLDAARSTERHSPRVVRAPGPWFTGFLVTVSALWLIGAAITTFGVAVSLVVLGAGALTVGLVYVLLRWGSED
jgi:hypothetical protein